MNSIRLTVQRNASQLRRIHKCVVSRRAAEAAVANAPKESMTIPVPEGVEKTISAKIDKIANEITALNLIEVSELSDLLKKRLNLPDAPVMPMGGFIAPQAAQEEEAKTVKTMFTVKLTSYNEKQKIALIKEIKNLLPDTNLVQAKKFVESIPNIVKADVTKEEADKLKEALVNAGAQVEIE